MTLAVFMIADLNLAIVHLYSLIVQSPIIDNCTIREYHPHLHHYFYSRINVFLHMILKPQNARASINYS